MTVFFWIMAACMYPVLLILYAVMRYYGKPRAGLLFGARLQLGLEREPELEAIVRRFKREVTLWLLVLAVLPLATLPMPYVSISITFWMLWCFGAIFVLDVPFARANRAVWAWKAEHGYGGERARRVLVETRELGRVRGFRWSACVAPTLISLGAAVFVTLREWGRPDMLGVAIIAFTFALVTPLLGACGLWMNRQRQKVISTDSQVNLNYNRARRTLWSRYWLVCLWLNTAVTAAFCLPAAADLSLGMWALLWGCAGYVVLLLAATGELMRRLARLDRAYRDQMDLAGMEEDDDCWLWGMIYYNPRDRKTVVEKRVGVGTAFNMAAPAGKALTIFLLVVLLGVLLVCVWSIRLEFTPIRLTIQGDILSAEQLQEDYAIPLADIEELTLVEELPDMARVNGTAMGNLSKGRYRLQETGESCRLFLDPRNTVFLSFYADGVLYYMSGTTDEDTLALYASLAEAA